MMTIHCLSYRSLQARRERLDASLKKEEKEEDDVKKEEDDVEKEEDDEEKKDN